MCFVVDQCILCIKNDQEIIRIFSSRGRELKIAEILADHFWFRVCLHPHVIVQIFIKFVKEIIFSNF